MRAAPQAGALQDRCVTVRCGPTVSLSISFDAGTAKWDRGEREIPYPPAISELQRMKPQKFLMQPEKPATRTAIPLSRERNAEAAQHHSPRPQRGSDARLACSQHINGVGCMRPGGLTPSCAPSAAGQLRGVASIVAPHTQSRGVASGARCKSDAYPRRLERK